MEQDMDKKGLIQWYDRNRWKVFLVTLASSVVVCILFAISNAFDLAQGFMLCEPEYIDYYKNYQSERIASANSIALITVIISLVMLIISLKNFKARYKSGVSVYNIALIAHIYSLGRYMYIMFDVYERIPYVGILYVALILYMLLALIINVIHFRKYRDTFTENNNIGGVVIGTTLLLLGLVVISMSGTAVEKANIKKEKDKYAAKEFGKMYEVLWVEPDESINENPIGFVGLQYVNLFNDRGRTYTAEELEQAINNSYYYTGSWYAIKEFNEDCKAIEEKYDFRKYSIDEDPDNQEGYEIFYQLVYRRLLCTGNEMASSTTTDEEKYDACLYVYKLLSSGKSMDKIGNTGDVITITYDGKPEAGENAVFTFSSDTENVYGVVEKWNGVVAVGIDDDTDRYYVYAEDELTFEEGCIYRADIAIYPEITYYFDEDVEIKLEGVDYEELEYTVYEDCILVEMWFEATDKQ